MVFGKLVSKAIALGLSVACPSLTAGLYLFEGESYPSAWSVEKGAIAISRDISKEGKSSLLWEFEAGGRLILNEQMGFELRPKNSDSNRLSTLVYWLHNNSPSSGHLTFRFYRDGRELSKFEVGLNFKGWRSAWIRYEWDLGEDFEEDPDQLVIEAPAHSGRLHWDMFATSIPIDSRSPVPDLSVPFIGQHLPKRAGDIWNKLIDYHVAEEAFLALGEESAFSEASIVTERWNVAFEDLFGINPNAAVSIEDWKGDLAEWELEYQNGSVRGYPIFFRSHNEMLSAFGFEPERNLRDFGKLFFSGAIGWTFAPVDEKEEWARGLLLMLKHLENQGWTEGSGQGVLHHLGYSMRELYRGIYLVRNLLQEKGKLLAARKLVAWYSGTGRIVDLDDLQPSVDVFNTQLEGILISILLHPHQASRERLLGALSDWLGACIQPSPGILPIFKSDGSVYHHRGHYPAYANGGFRGLSPVLYALGQTAYSLDSEALEVMKRALLAYRFYSQKYHWPRSISGRHPDGTWTLTEEAFYWIAHAGKSIDEDLAAAYLRLGKNTSHLEAFKRLGFSAELPPQGTKTMPYAGITLHRKDDWLALVRGFSKYLWSHESYVGANWYGRYLSHGTLELLHRGDPVNPLDSGFNPNGWDWFHLPGATNSVSDWAYLRSNILNLDDQSGFEELLLSTEAVNGGLATDLGGLHAVSLAGHAKYGDDLRARKSYIFISDWIICLGSGIRTENLDLPIHTTLYQNHLSPEFRDWKADPLEVSGLSFGNGFGSVRYIEDPTGVGYYFDSTLDLRTASGEQIAPNQKTERLERGIFAKAWIDHGISPDNATYAYAIHMQGALSEKTLPFNILRQDERAHVVEFGQGLIFHSFFEADVSGFFNGASPVLGVTEPVLIQSQFLRDGRLSLSLSNPDLSLYDFDGDQWDGNGQQQEVSIYSRPWQGNSAGETFFQIRIKGIWEASGSFVGELLRDKETTTLLMTIRGGEQTDFVLSPISE